MQKELITFEGGINNLIAPHLIPDNTCPTVIDADIISGVLESAPVPKVRDDLPYIGEHTIYYKAKDQLVGSMQHLQDPLNVDEDRFYVEMSGFLYWSNYVGDGTGKLQRYDGTNVSDLGGWVAPDTQPDAATDGTGMLFLDYAYCYTYIYEDSFESAPSPIEEIKLVDKDRILITFPATTGNATHRVLYRLGGLNPTFNKVAIIPIAEDTYIDNTSDFQISRQELNTATNDGPPLDMDMLTESFGTLFGAVGNRVHFSREGQPEYWSNYSYVQLPSAVTGLGTMGDYIIAFTVEEMYMITGRNMHNIAVRKLPYQYGCISKRSVKNLKGSLIWLTQLEQKYLICAFSGGDVQILNYANQLLSDDAVNQSVYSYFNEETYDDYSLTSAGAIVIGRKYMLFLRERTVVIDMETGLKIYYMSEHVTGAFELENALIISEPNDVGGFDNYQYIPSNAQKRNLEYQTKDFMGGSLVIDKSYRKISVNAEGTWNIGVYVDGKKVFMWDSTQGQTIFLPSGIHGKYISFNIKSEGYAKVKALQYEYQTLNDGFTTVK